MLVVDAPCLCEILIGAPGAETIRSLLAVDDDHAAPHAVDVEVFGVIRHEHLHGRLDRTAATEAIEDLGAWPGERLGHRPLSRACAPAGTVLDPGTACAEPGARLTGRAHPPRRA
jgi:predicted nucleic acid-binding protein